MASTQRRGRTEWERITRQMAEITYDVWHCCPFDWKIFVKILHLKFTFLNKKEQIDIDQIGILKFIKIIFSFLVVLFCYTAGFRVAQLFTEVSAVIGARKFESRKKSYCA